MRMRQANAQKRYDAPLPVLNTTPRVARNAPCAHELLEHARARSRPPAPRRRPSRARGVRVAVANRVLAHRGGVALALAQRAQNQPVAERAGHAQSAGVRRADSPTASRDRLAACERAHDRRAAVGLRDDHAREARRPSAASRRRASRANTFHMPISPVPPPVG